MSFRKIFYFFNCYYCGSWSYCDRIIKAKVCSFCGKIIIFDKVKKIEREINPEAAPDMMQIFKAQGHDTTKSKFITADELIGG